MCAVVWLPLNKLISSKPKLLAVIAGVVIAALAVPIVIPHLTDTSVVYHLLLHVVSLIIAIFLSAVSILSYLRNRHPRSLFMMSGFILLSIIEAMYLSDVSSNIQDIVIPGVDIEASHVIFLIMLTFFGIGIFKVNR